MGLKEVAISQLWGPCMYQTVTWILWVLGILVMGLVATQTISVRLWGCFRRLCLVLFTWAAVGTDFVGNHTRANVQLSPHLRQGSGLGSLSSVSQEDLNAQVILVGPSGGHDGLKARSTNASGTLHTDFSFKCVFVYMAVALKHRVCNRHGRPFCDQGCNRIGGSCDKPSRQAYLRLRCSTQRPRDKGL